MFGITLKHSFATVAVVAGLLAGAGPASAQTHVSDGTSNTIMFGVHAAAPILMADMGGQF